MRRILELDAIRGLAAVLIMLHHRYLYTFFFGWIGVDLFFVLSGYLITTIILKRHASSGFFLNFYMRRSLRIWPIYYLAFIGFLVVNPFLPEPYRIDGWPYFAVYLQNLPMYWFAQPPPFSPYFEHTWTLAIEEQFYLLWPGLLYLFRNRRVVWLAAVFLIVPLVARLLGFSSILLLGRCEGFGYGALLAWLFLDDEWIRPRMRRLGRLFLIVGFVAMVVAPCLCLEIPQKLGLPGNSVWRAVRFTFVDLFFACLVGLILQNAGSPLLRPLRDPRLVYFGQISYGLYLYHFPCYAVLDWLYVRMGFTRGLFWDALTIAASFALAMLSWKFVEQPFLSLKDRFNYGAKPPLAGPAIVGSSSKTSEIAKIPEEIRHPS